MAVGIGFSWFQHGFTFLYLLNLHQLAVLLDYTASFYRDTDF